MVSIDKQEDLFRIAFDYDARILAYFNKLPKELVKTKKENVLVEGQKVDVWYRYLDEATFLKFLIFLKDNSYSINFYNFQPEDFALLKKEYKDRRDRIRNIFKGKKKSLDYSKEDFSFLKKEPRPYQKEAFVFFEQNKGIALLGDQPGVGKSYPPMIYASKHQFKTLIICPASLKLTWRNAVLEFTHYFPFVYKYNPSKKLNIKTYTKEESLFHIINYESLDTYFKLNYSHTCGNNNCKAKFVDHKKTHKACPKCNLEKSIKSRITKALSPYEDDFGIMLNPDDYDLVVLDECFPYNTNVITEFGEMKIGYIIENKLKINILSYNLKNKKLEYKPINRWIKKENSNYLLEIKTEDGNVLTCTPNHKIYVNNEYIRADKIKQGDCLQKLSKSINKVESLEQTEVLLNCVSQKMDEKGIFKKAYKTLSMVFKKFCCEKQRDKILFSKLFCKMENVTTRNSKKSLFKRSLQEKQSKSKIELQKKSSKSVKLFNKNEVKQSNGQTREHRKDENEFCWKNFFIKRRKWEINETTNFGSQSFEQGLDNGASNKHSQSEEFVSISPKPLQSRYRESEFENSNRDRWSNSQDKKMEIFRQKERICVKGIRVESVTILEPGSGLGCESSLSKNNFVYNLEIDENHNYYANNILVSNCHYVKDMTAKRTKLVKKMFSTIPRRIMLSGTAIKNRTKELFPLLNFLNPEKWNNFHFFGLNYCAAYEGNFGWDYQGASNLEELFGKISPLFLRRMKEDVLKDLPPKTYTSIPITMTEKQVNEYKKIESGVIDAANEIDENDIEKSGNEEVKFIQLIQLLRQFTSKIKAEASIDYLNTVKETGRKIVVFSHYVASAEMMHENYKQDSVIFTGKNSMQEKQDAVDRFQKDKSCNFFFGTIGAAGVGITLTAADIALFIERAWSPSDNIQAEDRIHRLSQNSDNVQIVKLICEGTIDEHVENLLDKKESIINMVLDGKESEKKINRTELDVFKQLLYLYKNKQK